MKNRIERLLRILKICFIALWALPIALIILYETGIFAEGIYTDNVQMEYILQCICILLTVGMIPFSLRLFNLNLVKRIKELPLMQALESYLIWSEIRIFLLTVPTLVSTSFYYLTLNTTGLFCACMALVASLFCVPTYNRLLNELDLPEDLHE